jgi:hypothetical protein
MQEEIRKLKREIEMRDIERKVNEELKIELYR